MSSLQQVSGVTFLEGISGISSTTRHHLVLLNYAKPGFSSSSYSRGLVLTFALALSNRCVRLGVECVMQRRSRGRPPRRPTKGASQAQTAATKFVPPDVISNKPMCASTTSSSQPTAPAGDVSTGQVNQEGTGRKSAAMCVDIEGSEVQHRRATPIAAQPQAPPQEPLPQVPLPAPSPVSVASARPYQTPLDVLSSVASGAFSLVGAIPSPISRSVPSSFPTSSGGRPPVHASAETALSAVHQGVPLRLPSPRRSDDITELVSFHRDLVRTQAGPTVPTYAQAPEVAGPWEGCGQQAWGSRGRASPYAEEERGGGTADQLSEAFEALCTGITRLRAQGQLDIRKAEFVW